MLLNPGPLRQDGCDLDRATAQRLGGVGGWGVRRNFDQSHDALAPTERDDNEPVSQDSLENGGIGRCEAGQADTDWKRARAQPAGSVDYLPLVA